MSSSPKKPRSKPSSTSASQGGHRHRQHRRSQSTTRTAKNIRAGGSKRLADLLADALRGAHSDEEVIHSHTHGLHTYPARMHPATARALVDIAFRPDVPSDANKIVLDPFCGSGTTLVEARAAGYDVIGSDLNPLAVRIARAKIWMPDKDRLDNFRQLGHEVSAAAFEEGKAARRANYEPRPIRVPEGVDPVEREEEIGTWYAPHVRRELEFIAGAIDELREDDGDQEFAELLAVCLSSLLIKCSKRNSDTSSKLVTRNIARGAPARWFAERIDLLCEGLVSLHNSRKIRGGKSHDEARGGTAKVIEQDARDLSGLGNESVGAIVSSPPYVGTYDYVDHHRLRLAFLGLPFQQFEQSEIGARRRFKGRAKQATDDAFNDFRACLDSFYNVLVPGGRMLLMVGDSVAGVEPIWADELLRDLAGQRFRAVAWASQERDKLGSLEKRAFGDKAKREHILLFEKS